MPMRVGLNLHAHDDFRSAALPLFEADQVEILEYSFDTGWSGEPDWLAELVNYYSESRRLLGHGVQFSALSGMAHPLQDQWLDNLRREVARRNYTDISEHFGFMTTASFHDSAPLPVPRSRRALELGRARLAQLRAIAGVPVGLENLAFAFGPHDVREQGAFLAELLAPAAGSDGSGDDGFLLLDLHNIYCQMYNFDVRADALLDLYPLQRVRELHVSGGSWSQFEFGKFRRDTHDGDVPEEVYDLVTIALERCPHVEAVIFERLGGTLPTEAQRNAFRDDYRRLRELVRSYQPLKNRRPRLIPTPSPITEGHDDVELWNFQTALLELLSQPLSAQEKLARLETDTAFESYRDYVKTFDLRSIAVASELVLKWGQTY